jgi:AcrR family transcriptional regulator
MKTADKIVDTARSLFNEHGERNITATDIADALEISPGNLYYHFKGKDPIVRALWSRFEREFAGYLATSVTAPLTLFDEETPQLETVWLYLTVLMQTMDRYRFIYLGLDDLRSRYPDIDRGLRRLISLKRAACQQVALDVLALSQSDIAPPQNLADSMALTMTFWLSFDELQHPNADTATRCLRGVLQLLGCCAPYLGDAQRDFYKECELIYSRMLEGKNA